MRAYYRTHKEDYRRRATARRQAKRIPISTDRDAGQDDDASRKNVEGLGTVDMPPQEQERSDPSFWVPSLAPEGFGSPEDRYKVRLTELHTRYGSALPREVLDELLAQYDADLRAVGREPPPRRVAPPKASARESRPIDLEHANPTRTRGRLLAASHPSVTRTNASVRALATRLRTHPERVSKHLARLGFEDVAATSRLPADLDISELQASLARWGWLRPLSRRGKPLPARTRTLFDLVKRPVVVLDFETTGIDYRSGRVVEVGAIRLDAGGRTTLWAVVRPDGLESLPARLPGTSLSAERISVGVPSGTAFAELRELLADNPVVVGHNISYDLGFLTAELERHRLPTWRGDFICTLYLAALLRRGVTTDAGRGRVGQRWTDFVRYHYRLEDVCEALRIRHANPHRALPDAKATEKVAMRLLSDSSAKAVMNSVVGSRHELKEFEYMPPGARIRPTPERRAPKRSAPYRGNQRSGRYRRRS